MRVRIWKQIRSEKNSQARKNRMHPDGLNLAEEIFAAVPYGIYISTDSHARKYQLQTIVGAGYLCVRICVVTRGGQKSGWSE